MKNEEPFCALKNDPVFYSHLPNRWISTIKYTGEMMQFMDCQLCRAQQWEQITQLELGFWDKQQTELTRNISYYPMGKCTQCNHVQMMNVYTEELFHAIYFNSTQEGIFWDEYQINRQQPFEQMVELFAEYIQPKSKIVDFGCGPGDIFNILIQRYSAENLNLLGIDFNDRIEERSVKYVHGDLNALENLPLVDIQHINIALASHVLEHVIDPLKFLNSIKSNLSSSGKIFIEIPDFSDAEKIKRHAGLSNLVNLQHIHYFTTDSITFLAQQAGLEIVHMRQITTGYIPRLQLILAKSNVPQLGSKITLTAVDAIHGFMAGCNAKRLALKNKIVQSVQPYGRVGLWGVGRELVTLFHTYPELITHLHAQQIDLFDYELHDHSYLQEKIQSSMKLEEYDFPIFITPILGEVRIKMHQICQDWDKKIIDVYQDN